jgi:hypothetical protein
LQISKPLRFHPDAEVDVALFRERLMRHWVRIWTTGSAVVTSFLAKQ